VVDGSICVYPDLGLVENSVTLEIRRGRIEVIEGKREAKKFRKILEELDDPNVYLLAEVAVGLNPNCKLTGNYLEDEGAYGTMHFGFGFSYGANRATAHIDNVIRKPTLSLDGRIVLEKGNLRIR